MLLLVVLLCTFTFILSLGQSDELPSPTPTPTPKLLFVAELCRHGDRSPLYEFPSDALPMSRWPEGRGQLTAIGQRAQYDLGARLRARYVDTGFLSESYSHDELYARSTDVDRTLMSAMCQLTGLYPPGTASDVDVRVKFGKDPLHEDEGGLPHRFQPFPIHTESSTSETLLSPGANCPRHQQLMVQKFSSAEYSRKTQDEANFIQLIAKITKVPNPQAFSLYDVWHAADTWTCFNAHSVPLPEQVTPEVLSHARNISDWILEFVNTGLEVHRLRSGLILNNIREYLAMAALRDARRLPPAFETKAKKFVLYSAHDTTVAATLAALRVFDGKYPPYNSTLIWELYKFSNGSLFVRIEYNNQPLVLPGCLSADCPIVNYIASTEKATVLGELDRFVECLTGPRRYAAMLRHRFSKSKEDDAFSSFQQLSGDDQSSKSSPFTIFFIGIAVILGFSVLYTAWHIRSRYHGYHSANDEKDDDLRTETDPLASQRILM